ncbi:unnamed protein product [Phaedon cochleariae]|uniref:Receptor expression-enhancing protein n=1 Tax=Phaedon cochleariae TaxID=80249 RepID=A0A9P0GUA6_PHACE|nr:unnamed protein product [Phaedon cochleariae]
MISSILSRLVILLFGTLYPAYASYKAVRTKNVKEYVKWMMYWIVFALFTCIETFTDVFLSWFPFYYEIKIILVIWLLSPATKGSSILYRKFVHPTLSSREQEIDEYITKAKEQSYKQVLDLGSKGVSAIMQTALKGGGGLVNHLKKSYSLSDLSVPTPDEMDDVVITDARLMRRRRSPQRVVALQSAEDVSSGYSSGEGLSLGKVPQMAAKEGLQRAGSLTRSRTSRATRSNVPKKEGISDESDDNEIFETNVIFINDTMKKIEQLEQTDSSSSETEFLDSLNYEHVDSSINLINFNRNKETYSLLTACEDINPTTEEELSLKEITKDVDTFSNFVQNLIEAKNEATEDSTHNINEAKSDLKLEEETPIKRGGKYNKKSAPLPPTATLAPIKATLILKPGRLKTLDSPEKPPKEIFVSSKSSSSSIRSKPSFSRFIRLPKKISTWGRVEQEKRSSWHSYLGDDSHTPCRQSKSDNDLRSKQEDDLKDSDRFVGGSLLSVKSLLNSPVALRRLKVIRGYVDGDID